LVLRNYDISMAVGLEGLQSFLFHCPSPLPSTVGEGKLPARAE